MEMNRKWYLAAAFAVAATVAVACNSERSVAPADAPGAPRGAHSAVFDEFDDGWLGFVPDDNDANDTPAQSDLNAFTRADNVAGKIGVQWVWDDINSWTGAGQTGDACALFDTGTDGKADAAVCVRITNPGGDPNVIAQLDPGSPLVYSCGGKKEDRCSQPAKLEPLNGTYCEIEKIDGETFFAAGDDGADVLATCSIPLAAISATSTPNLLNVCSFPSGSPNSNPFDCVVTPGAGFLIIKKVTTPQSTGETFSFTVSPAVVSGASHSITDNTGTGEQTLPLSAAPGTYSVTEGALSTGWTLDAASCELQTSPTPTSTGTKSGNAVTGVSITSGETTICTFTNSFTAELPDISVLKEADVETIAADGGTSVDDFEPDQTFARNGGGGGNGGSTPIFGGDTCDDAGPNDEPAQSDLNCFSRADNVAGRLWVRWTWDDINAWTGAGQTGDACALLDTDGNSKANFAFCARVTNPGGDPTQVAQADGSPILYKCKDTANSGSIDRCASKTQVQPIHASTQCTISLVDEHFVDEGDDGFDTEAECDLRLLDLGQNINVADVDLLNVCSYPSGSPNSNPFDCVVSPAAGFLVIAKETTPEDSDSYFGFRLRNAANTANATATNGHDEWAVQGGATSAGIPILPGTYALTELLPTNWTLDADGISCERDGQNAAGATDGTTKLGITIVQGQTTTCTFSNTLTGSGLVTFTVEVTNNGSNPVTLFSLEDTENPNAQTPTYVTLDGEGTCETGGSIAGGATYSCTFTRTVSGPPGTVHRNRVRAVAKNADDNSDTETSGIVTVTIIE